MPNLEKEFLTPLALRQSVADAARSMHMRGWTPATSSNFSMRMPGNAGLAISISGLDKGALTAQDFLEVPFPPTLALPPLGGGECDLSFMNGNTINSLRPSAETPLHAMIYQHASEAQTVLHSHSVDGTVLSKLWETEGGLWLKNLELLKAFEGVKTHDTSLWLPIFPNSQDMNALSQTVSRALLRFSSAGAINCAPTETTPNLESPMQTINTPTELDDDQSVGAQFIAPASERFRQIPIYGFLLAGHGLYTWGKSTADALRHVEAFEFLFATVLKLRAYGYADYS